jgi:hypothetical protein
MQPSLALDLGTVHQWIAQTFFGGEAWIYNGSATRIGDSIHYACRARDRREGRNSQSYIITQQFTTNWEPIPNHFPTVLDIPAAQLPDADTGPQDPRVFELDGKPCVVYNILCDDGVRRMGMKEEGKAPVMLILLDRPARHTEKNWTPLVARARLHFIYSFAPFTVVECNRETGYCRTIHETPTSALNPPNPSLRGGTPALSSSDGGFIGLLHSTVHTPRPVLEHQGYDPERQLPEPARRTSAVYRAHAFRVVMKDNGGYDHVVIGEPQEVFKRQIEQPYGIIYSANDPSSFDVVFNVDDCHTVVVHWPVTNFELLKK